MTKTEPLWVNLGCNDDRREGFVNVDKPDYDLEKDWPWCNDVVDYILARDIIEHLRDKIHTMNEAWRVLKPKGIFDIEVPTTEGRGAFQDPDHKTWWNRNSFFYFTDGDPHRERFGKSYGIAARFDVVREETMKLADEVTKLRIVLRASK